MGKNVVYSARLSHALQGGLSDQAQKSLGPSDIISGK